MSTRYLAIACISLLLAFPLAARAQDNGGQSGPGTIEDFSENSLVIASAKYLGATAETMGEIIDRIFSRYGTPSAVIRGEEVSVSVMFGARYGRGTLLFPDGSEYPVYWRGPSAGVDLGASGNESFTLVYNITAPKTFINALPVSTARWSRLAASALIICSAKTPSSRQCESASAIKSASASAI